jgi:hypothetical protein
MWAFDGHRYPLRLSDTSLSTAATALMGPDEHVKELAKVVEKNGQGNMEKAGTIRDFQIKAERDRNRIDKSRGQRQANQAAILGKSLEPGLKHIH